MRKINPRVLLTKNEARLEKMIKENYPKKRITQQKKRVEELKKELKR